MHRKSFTNISTLGLALALLMFLTAIWVESENRWIRFAFCDAALILYMVLVPKIYSFLKRHSERHQWLALFGGILVCAVFFLLLSATLQCVVALIEMSTAEMLNENVPNK